MGTIQINNLSFKYNQMSDQLFDHVDLNIDEAWKLGLIGRNGRGKTTLLKILMHQLDFQGQITTNLQFYYYPQKIVHLQQTVRNLVLKLSGLVDYDMWKIEMELAKLKLSSQLLERKFSTLSPGERTKLLLAVMFANSTGFQLIDEPTNHLDIEGRKVVADYLRAKKGFIVISHDRNFLNQIIDHVISINRKDITVYQGDFDTWETSKTQHDQHELNEKNQLQKDIKLMQQSAVKKSNWAQQTEKGKQKNVKMDHHANLDKGFLGHKSAKMMKKARMMQKRTEKAIDQKEQLLQNIEIEQPLTFNYQKINHFDYFINVEKLQLSNQDTITPKVSFTVKEGEIVAFVGPNGAGKSTVLKTILGEKLPFEQSGLIDGKKLLVSYLPQETRLRGTIKQVAKNYDLEIGKIFSTLRKLGFERVLFNEPIENMSQGQKQKVALSVSLSTPANLYLWDEPFNYLDVITRDQIVTAIKKQHPTMLLIDHDFGLLEEITDQKVSFKK